MRTAVVCRSRLFDEGYWRDVRSVGRRCWYNSQTERNAPLPKQGEAGAVCCTICVELLQQKGPSTTSADCSMHAII